MERRRERGLQNPVRLLATFASSLKPPRWFDGNEPRANLSAQPLRPQRFLRNTSSPRPSAISANSALRSFCNRFMGILARETRPVSPRRISHRVLLLIRPFSTETTLAGIFACPPVTASPSRVRAKIRTLDPQSVHRRLVRCSEQPAAGPRQPTEPIPVERSA